MTTRYVTGGRPRTRSGRGGVGARRRRSGPAPQPARQPPAPAPAPSPPPPPARAGPEQRVVTDDPATTPLPAFGTYGFLAVRRADGLTDALAPRADRVADVDATCSRFRADSDLSRVNRAARAGGSRSTRCWSRRSRSRCEAAPADRRAGAPAARPPAGAAGLRPRLRAARSGRGPTTPPCPTRTPPPASTPGGRSGSTRRARAHPRRHRARPRRDRQGVGRRPGRRRARAASSACRRWSASAATCGSPRPTAARGRWRSPSAPAARRDRPWSASTAAAWPPRAPGSAAGRRGGVRHHLLDPRTAGRPPRCGARSPPPGRPASPPTPPAPPRSSSAPRPRGLARRTRRHRPAGRDRRPASAPVGGWPLDATRRGLRRMTDGPLLWYLNRGSGVVAARAAHADPCSACCRSAAGRLAASPVRHPGPAPQPRAARVRAAGRARRLGGGRQYVDIRWWQAFVPFGATYEPLWLGLGALAARPAASWSS